MPSWIDRCGDGNDSLWNRQVRIGDFIAARSFPQNASAHHTLSIYGKFWQTRPTPCLYGHRAASFDRVQIRSLQKCVVVKNSQKVTIFATERSYADRPQYWSASVPCQCVYLGSPQSVHIIFVALEPPQKKLWQFKYSSVVASNKLSTLNNLPATDASVPNSLHYSHLAFLHKSYFRIQSVCL